MSVRTSAPTSSSAARSLRVLAVVASMLVACYAQQEPAPELATDTPRPASPSRLVLQITVDHCGLPRHQAALCSVGTPLVEVLAGLER